MEFADMVLVPESADEQAAIAESVFAGRKKTRRPFLPGRIPASRKAVRHTHEEPCAPVGAMEPGRTGVGEVATGRIRIMAYTSLGVPRRACHWSTYMSIEALAAAGREVTCPAS